MRGFDEILGPDIGVPSKRRKNLRDRTEFRARSEHEPRFERQVIEGERSRRTSGLVIAYRGMLDFSGSGDEERQATTRTVISNVTDGAENPWVNVQRWNRLHMVRILSSSHLRR